MMAEHPGVGRRDPSSLRAVALGGMTAPPALVRHLEASVGAQVSIMFGSTELCGLATQVCLDDDETDRATTIGCAHPRTEVKIAEIGTGAVVPCGEVGEIGVRGYLVMIGYFEMPEATAAAIDAEAWMHTGDLGSTDNRGFCRFEGKGHRAHQPGWGEDLARRARGRAGLASGRPGGRAARRSLPDDQRHRIFAGFVPESGRVWRALALGVPLDRAKVSCPVLVVTAEEDGVYHHGSEEPSLVGTGPTCGSMRATTTGSSTNRAGSGPLVTSQTGSTNWPDTKGGV